MTAKDIQTNYNYMDEEINLEEEENQNRLNLEEAVLDEEDEAKVKQHAIDQGAFPDENI